jgi:hypothetical protein
MTCKDCIHYEICSLWSTTDLDEDKTYEFCYGRFKDKADFTEVKHGKWIPRLVKFGSTAKNYVAREQCSNCKNFFVEQTRYCPDCGAKMVEENKK